MLATLALSLMFQGDPNWADRLRLEQRSEEVKREEARRKHDEYLRRQLEERWNDYAAKMNAFVERLASGVVDTKALKEAMKAWEQLQRCEAWPKPLPSPE